MKTQVPFTTDSPDERSSKCFCVTEEWQNQSVMQLEQLCILLFATVPVVQYPNIQLLVSM